VALWKIINEEDAILIPKLRGENFSSGIFAFEIFWGRVSRYAATPLIVVLSPDYSDITRFRPWSPIAAGNLLDCALVFFFFLISGALQDFMSYIL